MLQAVGDNVLVYPSLYPCEGWPVIAYIYVVA